jgi:hypothetical protein
MIQFMDVQIKGIAPLLLHNGDMADPLNPLAQEMKKVSGKRNKTIADHEELARLEWHASLYQKDGKICVPGVMLDKAIIEAARKSRKGKQAQAGVMVIDDPLLDFSRKSKALSDIYASGHHTDRRMVVVSRARIARTRPRFDVWGVAFTLQYDDEQLSDSDILDMIDIAGQSIGIGDFRPRFGRFERV